MNGLTSLYFLGNGLHLVASSDYLQFVWMDHETLKTD